MYFPEQVKTLIEYQQSNIEHKNALIEPKKKHSLDVNQVFGTFRY